MNTLARLSVSIFLLVPAIASWAQKSPLLERGRYLMESVVACGNCHLARGDKGQPLFEKGLSGGMLFDEPPFKAYAANITPDPDTGIGKWTDAQLARAIRDGVRPDKSVIGPPMPSAFYRKISDDDLAAIIAYLRAQSAVKNEVPRSKYDMPLPPNYGSAIQHVKAPSSASKLRYGEYLANIGHCMECHTPRDSRGMLVTTSLGAGGQLFKGPWGESISRNLTPDETGLKNWTDEQVIKALREGVDRNGQPYKPPMAFGFYRNISDADMGALLVYLRSLKAQPLGGKK